MRQVTKKGLITVAAAGGVLALSGGSAFADSTAEGGSAKSPGVLSGNTAQVPVHVPVNVCGNTVDVVGALNPTFGNKCANVSSAPKAEKPKADEPKAEKPEPKPEEPKAEKPEEPKQVDTPPQPKPQTLAEPQVETELAETGGGKDLGIGLSLGAGLLIGGTVLYRRSRVARR
ncbi:chaplin [Streptomyces sp. N2-109]|uniref:Chaplin n=1 Tax=Streptomyces gossypii TaxID=2883101 RepID=A0ABT2JLJ2_9ACTN|nr:chaplin [Streptomyces gossypii]MCT2588740.1 chaplin [Streptomyces gossypii]